MQVCIVYDCLFPYTIGGAERWYRNVAEALVADGHDLTYLTLPQWERVQEPDLPGIRVVAVGPRLGLDTESGRRRLLPPLVFGFGVLRHLLRHLLRHGRRYEVVDTPSFPCFSLLARGVPVVVVAGLDNAATQLVEEGVNGTIAPSARPGDVADALVAVHHRGQAMRASTSDWFVRNAARLSLRRSVDVVLEGYGGRG